MDVSVKVVKGVVHGRFNHAVSVIMLHVSSAEEKDLELILAVQHDLLKFTLSRINSKRRAQSEQ